MAGNVRDILINLLGRETISKATDRASKGLGDLDDKMKATAADGARLDAELGKAERSLKDLAVQYARTGDAAERVDLSKAMRRQQAEIRRLTKARDLLPPFDVMGRESADRFGVSFFARVGPVLAKAPMGPAGAAIGTALAVGILPPLMAALGGATLGAGVAAAVAGGVVVAARDSRVQSAGKELGSAVLADLENTVGARFVQPTLAGIRIIRQGWQDIRGDVDGLAREAARFVEPLSRGLVGLLREFLPGLREGLSKAAPIARELELGFTRVGRSLGDLFRTLGNNADEGAAGLRWLFLIIDGGIRIVGGAIDAFGDFYRVLLDINEQAGKVAKVWGWIPVIGDWIGNSNDRLAEQREALELGGDAGSEAGDKIAGGFRRAGGAAADSAQEIKTWAQVLEESRQRAFASEHAQLRFEEAIDSAAEAAREGARKGIDPNTEAGRRNRRALLDLAAAANEAAADIKETTGSQELATEATERGRRRFLAAAEAMGVESRAARDLANKLFGIPDVDAKVRVDTKTAMSQVEAYRRWLRSVNLDKTSTVRQRIIREQGTARGGVREFSRGGYVDGPGPKGVDSEPAVLAPGEGVLTAAEVDRMGGRAGFERLRKVIASGGTAAAFGGSAVSASAAPAYGAGRQVVEHVHRIVIEGTGVLAGFRREIRIDGGDVIKFWGGK